ncbi:ABC transporter permease [Desulforamulus ruminis]|uniref:ABC-2 type transporter n=1 Tax=Desulforamulus ruminis (strain ATCC 23193 / DSM 2154 / NCIMB 8452 / DL) TaxID=696281 RepID=F6DNC3_DESRL|nr:ABC transporter permease [Desulforamulus ruminis]AEG61814.1 ABC-2 type transporter [Desulforamulus ruminis DSM 2154]
MIRALIQRELLYLWRDRGLRNILLFGSLLGLALFFATYSAQVLQNIPTAVVDLDHSSASHQLIEKVAQAENLQVAAYPDSYEEAEELMKRGKIVVTMVIPENYGKTLALGRQGNVYMAIDGSNMIYSTNATTAALTVAKTISAQAGVKALLARGFQPSEAQNAYLGVELREEAWFNPTLNYAYFLVLALVLNIWQQCCTLAAATNIISETGRPSWKQFKMAGLSKWTLFASKSAVHIVLFMFMVLPVYLISFAVFKVPLHCSGWLLLFFTLAFTIALHSVGTFTSSIGRNAVDTTRYGMIIALPSFILSGYGWPLESMPAFLQSLVKLLPQTWFFQGLNYLTFKNPDLSFVQTYFWAFGIISVVCYGATALLTSRK